MQEKQVTVAHTSHQLEEPFFVMATQNPLEMAGTYPLPEAQLDSFSVQVVRSVSPPRRTGTAFWIRTTQNASPSVATGDRR